MNQEMIVESCNINCNNGNDDNQLLVNELGQETRLSIESVDLMKKSVNYLLEDFKLFHLQSNRTKMSIQQFTDGILDLEFTFKQVSH